MSSRLLNWVAVIALTIALGGHWAILQSLAWVTMVVGYSQTAPLKAALAKTFDGKHPCPLCQFVEKEKKSEQKGQTQKLLTKLDFFLVLTRPVIYPPAPPPPRVNATRCIHSWSDAPPTPPPRSLLG